MASGDPNYTPYRKRKFRGMPKGVFRRRRMRMDVSLITLLIVLVAMLLSRYAPDGAGEVELKTGDATTAVASEDSGAEEEQVADAPVAKAGAPVRFLMQNVQNYFVKGERQRSRYNNTIKKDADREAVADNIASVRPEIVGLVEIGGPLALEDLAGRLEKRGLSYPYRFVLTREGEDRALAILSRHPIVRNDSHADYPLFGTHNRKMLRGILDVTVRVADGREFRILGAHLKSHKGASEAATTHLRTQEARTVALYVEKIMKGRPKMPVLVFGDWNDGPAEGSLGILRQGTTQASALTRLKPADERGEEWTHHYRAGGEYLIYDQIYVNAPLRTRMGRKSKNGVSGTGNYGSDHRAVWCELR